MNCPCTIHTQKRGHEWIVFNRLPDRIPSNPDDESHMSDSDDTVGFSETEENAENETTEVADTTSGSQNPEEMEEEDKNNNQDCTDASGASSEKFTSADLTAGYHSIFNPTVSNSSSELSLVSRDENHIRCKKNDTRQNKAQKKNKRPTKTAIPDSLSISDHVRYHVPKFPHSSATFNIILGSHFLTSPKVLQGVLGNSCYTNFHAHMGLSSPVLSQFICITIIIHDDNNTELMFLCI